MKLEKITFRDGEEGSEPDTITVTMLSAEALLITRMIGNTNNVQREEFMVDGGRVGSDVWNTLVGDVWNRYYDSGERGAS